jgi:uncharacterized protein involved in exopolysaccharide biosynthesis
MTGESMTTASETQGSSASTPTPNRSIDLLEIVDVTFRHWYWPAIAAVLVGAAFWLYSDRSPPLYRAEALVTLVTEAGSGTSEGGMGRLGAVASMVGISLGGQERKAEYVALLSSRRIVAQLIESRNLLPILYASAWDPEQKRWRKKAPTVNQAIQYFNSKVLRVGEDRRTGLVKVTVEWFDRELAADWANSLVAMVNADVRATTITEAKKSIEFLNNELEHTGQIAVREGIFRLMQGSMSRITLANVQEQYALKLLDPAWVPDLGQHVRPRPLLAAVAGGLLGIILGLAAVLWRNRRRWIV